MTGQIDARLKELGIELPNASAPAANYVPYVVTPSAATGALVTVSGQIPVWNGELRFNGKLGRELGVEEGRQAARLCGLNLIAQLRAACGGDLDRVERVVKLGGFVNAVEDFTNHPEVVNGASDLMVELFGEKGRHARFAMGAGSLPRGVAVEVEGVFLIAEA